MAIVYRECAPGLSRYAGLFSSDTGAAQDAMQETFLRYFIVRSGGKHIEYPKAWLYRVLRNYLVDSARAACVRGEVALASVPETRDHGADLESAVHCSDFLRRARQALAPREMECLRLRSEGLDYGEIAAALEIRPGTVSALLARAHKKIRQWEQTHSRQARFPLLAEENPYASRS